MFDLLINLIAEAAFINSSAAWPLDLLSWPVSSSGAAAPAPSLTPCHHRLPTPRPLDVRLTATKGHRQISMIKVGAEHSDLSRSH